MLHEFVRGIEVGRDGPFTEPHGKVPGGSGILDPVDVWIMRASARVPSQVQLSDSLLQMVVK